MSVKEFDRNFIMESVMSQQGLEIQAPQLKEMNQEQAPLYLEKEASVQGDESSVEQDNESSLDEEVVRDIASPADGFEQANINSPSASPVPSIEDGEIQFCKVDIDVVQKATPESLVPSKDDNTLDPVVDKKSDSEEDSPASLPNTAAIPAPAPAVQNEEVKKAEKKKAAIYSFLMAFMAHPVTKAASVVVFTASLIALGAVFTTFMSIAMASALATVGLFSSGYVYHRAQTAKQLEDTVEFAATPTPA